MIDQANGHFKPALLFIGSKDITIPMNGQQKRSVLFFYKDIGKIYIERAKGLFRFMRTLRALAIVGLFCFGFQTDDCEATAQLRKEM